ncbi:hypothetical protein [Tunturiibacter lichenicola]|uniref:hypothetical protein n=1 Tax=Tunturiibacter lichenicola TaxID=2051959 RepID=UPI003D9BB57D
MRCDEAAESVSALCDGEIITHEAAAHIRTCDACAELMEQYTTLGATLRREASLALGTLPSTPRWEKRTGIFTRLWRKGWETMRVPRLAFVALVLVALLTVAAEWKRARVGAESSGSVVLVTVDREDQSVFSSCALSLVDSSKDSMAMGGVLDSKKDLAAAISLKLAGRVEGGVRLLVKSYAGPITKVNTSDLAKLPERDVILMPGVPLKVAMGDSGTLTLHGEWFDHIPAEIGMGIKSIDPDPNELRIQQPVLLKGDIRILSLAGRPSHAPLRPSARAKNTRGKGLCAGSALGLPRLSGSRWSIAAAPQWLIDSAFTGLEEQSSGKVLAFPNSLSQEASTTARPPGLSYAKLLPFVAQACPSDPRHRVVIYMSFQFHRDRWRCNFLEKDLQTRLPRTLNLATAEEVIALADRGGGLSNLAGRHALDLAIATGRGGVFLALTTDQHTQLQKYCKPASAGSHSRYL